MVGGGEIIVVPFHGQGHIFPATVLCHHLATRDHHVALFLPPSSSSPPLHPLIKIVKSSSARPPPPPGGHPPPPSHHQYHHPEEQGISLEEYLSRRSDGPNPPSTTCVIVDVMMSHLIEICRNHGIPAVSFFTSSACSAALEHAVVKISPENLNPGDDLVLPGLPDDMSVTLSDLTRQIRPPPPFGPDLPPPFADGPPPPPLRPRGGAPPASPFPPPFGHTPAPGGPPPWVGETGGAIALLFNTCDELERPFLEYVAKETGKPVWGVGPLLPAQLWTGTDSPVHDEDARPQQQQQQHESNVTDDQVKEWLNSKPRDSVIYVSFGTVVGPSNAELAELAAALGESDQPFIWVLQAGAVNPTTGFAVNELAVRAGDRGLVIRGWAPQLLILSHPSTAAFLTHCGWNSTVEALLFGVPLLTWPVRGDQVYNAKLVTNRLKVGREIRAAAGPDGPVTSEDVARAIEGLVADEGIRGRAASVRSIFDGGFPKSSSDSIDALVDLVSRNPPSV